MLEWSGEGEARKVRGSSLMLLVVAMLNRCGQCESND